MDTLKISFSRRMKEMIAHHHDSVSDLAKKLGKGSGNFYLMLDEDRRQMPNSRMLIELVEIYPNVNADWLLYGRGHMLIEAYEDNHKEVDLEVAEDFSTIMEYLERVGELINKNNLDHYKPLKKVLEKSYIKSLTDISKMYKILSDVSPVLKKAIDRETELSK